MNCWSDLAGINNQIRAILTVLMLIIFSNVAVAQEIRREPADPNSSDPCKRFLSGVEEDNIDIDGKKYRRFYGDSADIYQLDKHHTNCADHLLREGLYIVRTRQFFMEGSAEEAAVLRSSEKMALLRSDSVAKPLLLFRVNDVYDPLDIAEEVLYSSDPVPDGVRYPSISIKSAHLALGLQLSHDTTELLTITANQTDGPVLISQSKIDRAAISILSGQGYVEISDSRFVDLILQSVPKDANIKMRGLHVADTTSILVNEIGHLDISNMESATVDVNGIGESSYTGSVSFNGITTSFLGFRKVNVKGDFKVSSGVSQDVLFEELTVSGSALIRNSSFSNGNLGLRNMAIRGNFDITNCLSSSAIMLHDVRVDGAMSFTNNTFSNKCRLSSINVRGALTLPESNFQGGCSFDSVDAAQFIFIMDTVRIRDRVTPPWDILKRGNTLIEYATTDAQKRRERLNQLADDIRSSLEARGLQSETSILEKWHTIELVKIGSDDWQDLQHYYFAGKLPNDRWLYVLVGLLALTFTVFCLNSRKLGFILSPDSKPTKYLIRTTIVLSAYLSVAVILRIRYDSKWIQPSYPWLSLFILVPYAFGKFWIGLWVYVALKTVSIEQVLQVML